MISYQCLPKHTSSQGKYGFTLVEILVVLGIVALLGVLAVPAVSALSQANDINQAVTGISLELGQARGYAIAHNSYVWVGIAPAPDDPTSLVVGAISGTTGSANDIASNLTYIPIAKMQQYAHCALKTVAEVEASNKDLTGLWSNGTDIVSAAATFSFSETHAGSTVTFPAGTVVQFDPAGEASLTGTGALPHWIQFGLQPVRGSNTTSANVAALQIAGLSGQVQIFRP